MKKILATILTILLFFTGCSSAESTEQRNYEYDIESVFATAEQFSALEGFTNDSINEFLFTDRYFTVNKTSDTEFAVDVNGTEMIIQIPEETDDGKFVPTKIKDLPKKYNTIISSSKEIIYNYIDCCNYFKDKDEIKNYISSLEVKQATFSDKDNVGAYFCPEDGAIYVNKTNIKYISEWMIVHEFVHAISYVTHGYTLDYSYSFNRFNEILTDIITYSLNPNIAKGSLSNYAFEYSLLYPYINLLKDEAFIAYYYGYDKVYEVLNYDELELLVIIIENYGQPNTVAYYNNIVFKWYAELINC